MLQVVSDGGTTLIVYDHIKEGETTFIQELVLDKPHVACDRVDVVYYSLEGSKYSVGALKGEVAEPGTPAAMFPIPPELPKGVKALATVRLRAGCDTVGDFDIQHHDSSVKTGEIPPVSFQEPPTESTEIVPAVPIGQIEYGYTGPGLVGLDPTDHFEARLIEIVEINRKKRADYAAQSNPYLNFDRNAASLGIEGYGPLEDCLSMITRKIGRITNLRGRPPQNETVLDSWLDLAVYSILGYGIATREAEWMPQSPEAIEE